MLQELLIRLLHRASRYGHTYTNSRINRDRNEHPYTHGDSTINTSLDGRPICPADDLHLLTQFQFYNAVQRSNRRARGGT